MSRDQEVFTTAIEAAIWRVLWRIALIAAVAYLGYRFFGIIGWTVAVLVALGLFHTITWTILIVLASGESRIESLLLANWAILILFRFLLFPWWFARKVVDEAKKEATIKRIFVAWFGIVGIVIFAWIYFKLYQGLIVYSLFGQHPIS